MNLGLESDFDYLEDDNFLLQLLLEDNAAARAASSQQDGIESDLIVAHSSLSQSANQEHPVSAIRQDNEIANFQVAVPMYQYHIGSCVLVAPKGPHARMSEDGRIRKSAIGEGLDSNSNPSTPSSNLSSTQQSTPESELTAENEASVHGNTSLLSKEDISMISYQSRQTVSMAAKEQPKDKETKQNPASAKPVPEPVREGKVTLTIGSRQTPQKSPDSDQSDSGPSTNRSRRPPRPNHSRFFSSGFINLIRSKADCLDVVLDYQKYTGDIENINVNTSLINTSCAIHDRESQANYPVEPIMAFTNPTDGNFLEFVTGPQPNTPVSVISGMLQRKVFTRNIDEIKNMVGSIIYVEEPRFGSRLNPRFPYFPQFNRFELDVHGNRVNRSKSGLCPYCPEVKFFALKNANYSSHLSLVHGIFSSGKLVPDALYLGKYQFCYTKQPEHNKIANALQCPACFCVCEVTSWNSKNNPLLAFYRHYIDDHSNVSDLTGKQPAAYKIQWREGNKVTAEYHSKKLYRASIKKLVSENKSASKNKRISKKSPASKKKLS